MGKTHLFMDKSGQKDYPKGHFPLRIRAVRKLGSEDASELLSKFIDWAAEKYALIRIEPLCGGKEQAEAVISVPFPDRERIRIDFNIYASQTDEAAGTESIYFHMESAF